MQTAETAMRCGNPNCITDALTGCAIAYAGARGGIWNVLINLKDIADASYVAEIRPACAQLLEDAGALLARATGDGDKRIDAMLRK